MLDAQSYIDQAGPLPSSLARKQTRSRHILTFLLVLFGVMSVVTLAAVPVIIWLSWQRGEWTGL